MFYLQEVTYKNVLAINSLQINEGNITCILGESGSGKTTLLKLLNQMISHDSGDIFYKNQNILDIDPITLRRRVVMLPQSPITIPGSIRDNLNLGFTLTEETPQEDDALQEMLAFVSLPKSLDADPTKLSGGEKQRLSLARIMLMDPEVFLLDEPSSSLDEDLEDQIMNEFTRYAKENQKTVVFVTHNKQVGERISDEIVLLKNGSIMEGQVTRNGNRSH